jgi:endoglucanase
VIATIIRPLGAAAIFALAGAAYPATGYVRVNQAGYEAGLPMRAYLMSPGTANGEKFTVEAAGGVVATGIVGGKLGDWGSYSIYPIDFSLSGAGQYTVRVSGSVGAASPAFPVATSASLYGALLGKTLQFYQNERDGPDYIPSALRTAPGHLNDARAAVYRTPAFAGARIVGALGPTGAAIDASGGWWDAGDYLKFVETASYAVALMEIGIRDFPNEMGAGSAASDFTAEGC